MRWNVWLNYKDYTLQKLNAVFEFRMRTEFLR